MTFEEQLRAGTCQGGVHKEAMDDLVRERRSKRRVHRTMYRDKPSLHLYCTQLQYCKQQMVPRSGVVRAAAVVCKAPNKGTNNINSDPRYRTA